MDRTNATPVRAWLGAAALLLLGACDSQPRLSLQQVMYQIDWDDKRIQGSLGDPAGLPTIVEAGEQMQQWLKDPAFERHLQDPTFSGDPAHFTQLRRHFADQLGAVLAAARAGDAAGTQRAYGPMRMACEVCHQTYRPGL